MRLAQVFFMTLFAVGNQACAQAVADGPAPFLSRWTLGGQLAAYPRLTLAEGPTGQRSPVYVRPWPAMLVVRYAMTSRAALEAGLLLRMAPAHTGSQATPDGTYATTRRAIAWAVPVVSRVRMAPRQPQRWQLDAKMGIMPLSTKYTEVTTFTDARTGQVTARGNSSQAYSDVPLLVGIGATYAVTPQIGLTADARLLWSFLLTIVGKALVRRDFTAPVMPAVSAGVSYQLGTGR